MNRYSKIFGCVIATMCFALTLVATPNVEAKKIDSAALEAIARVGVVSVAGDTMICRRFGVTAFGNKYETFDMADWGLDAEWQQQLQEAVAATGKFEIVPLSRDDRARLLDPLKDEFPDEKRLSVVDAEIAKEVNVDAVLLLASPVTDLYTRELYLEKYGVFIYKAAFKKNVIYYLSGRLYLLDSAGKILDTQYLPGQAPKALGPIPHVKAPEDVTELWCSDYTTEQNSMLREFLVEIPKPLWAPALEKLLETK